jgi:hypothetical protein
VIDETENKETEAELGRKNTQAKNDILKARAQASNRYVTTFEPQLFCHSRGPRNLNSISRYNNVLR